MDDIYWISVLFLDILPFLLKKKIIISLLCLWSVIFNYVSVWTKLLLVMEIAFLGPCLIAFVKIKKDTY